MPNRRRREWPLRWSAAAGACGATAATAAGALLSWAASAAHPSHEWQPLPPVAGVPWPVPVVAILLPCLVFAVEWRRGLLDRVPLVHLFGIVLDSPARPGWLLSLVVIAVAVRVPWLSSDGYAGDVLEFAQWGAYVVDHGIGTAYVAPSIDVAHGPVWLALVGGMSGLWTATATIGGQPSRPVPVAVIKLPLVLADLLIGWLLFRAARPRWRPTAAAGLAALYLLNPGVVIVGAWWGQNDGLVALWVLVATLALAGRRAAAASIAAVIGVLTKLQAYFLAPLAAVVLARSAPPRELLLGAAASAGVALAILSPFMAAGEPLSFAANYVRHSNIHPQVHNNAFNVWWIGREWSGNALPDSTPLLGDWSFKQAGLALLAAYTLLVLGRLWARFDRAGVPLAAAALAMSFFMLPTQMHTRYLLPALPLVLLASVSRPRLLVAYVVLSLTFFLNQVHLIFRSTGPPPALLDDRGPLYQIGLGTTTMAWLNVATFAVMTWMVFRPPVGARLRLPSRAPVARAEPG